MGLQGKVFVAVISLTVLANYSKVLRSSMATVRRSVGTVELTRIDKCLRQHHVMKMADAGTYGSGYFFPKDQAEFESVLRDSFDTPGRDPTLDNWGNTFQYKGLQDGFLLVSLGADGRRDTDDDLWLERHGKKVAMSRGLTDVQSDLIGQIDKVAKAQKQAADALQEAAAEAKAAAANVARGSGVAGARLPARAQDVSAPAALVPTDPPPGTGPPTRKPPAAEQAKPPRPSELSPKQERKAKYLLAAAKNMRMNNLNDKARKYYQRLVSDFGDTTYGKQAADALAKLPE